MLHSSSFIRRIIVNLLFFFLVLLAKVNAQPPSQILTGPVNNPVITNLPFGTISKEVGNDLWEDADVTFKTTVNSTGIYWNFASVGGGTSDGIIAFPADVISPDVSIVYDSYFGNYYALVVYFNSNDHTYYLGQYNIAYSTGIMTEMIAAGSPFYLDQPATDPLPNTNAIRMDANSIGDFVIVWEDPTDPVLRTWGGFTLGGGPGLSSNGFSDIPNTQYLYKHADVALDEADFSASRVYYAFLTVGSDDIVINQNDFTDVYDGIFTSSVDIWKTSTTATMGDYYGRPRIACSGDDFFAEDWTVVYEYNHGINSDIVGTASYLGNFYDHIYTDGSEYQMAEDGAIPSPGIHELPVISYGKDGNSVGKIIQIAWRGSFPDNYTSSGPNYIGTDGWTTVISLSLQSQGYVQRCYPSPALFEIVTDDGIYNYNDIYEPSLCGKHGYLNDNMIICWQDDVFNSGSVLEKTFNWCDGSFRPGHSNPNNIIATNSETVQPNSIIYPNPSTGTVKLNLHSLKNNESYTMMLHDLIGRKLATISGSPRTLESVGCKSISLLNSGIYVLSIYDKKQMVLTTKVIRK